MTVSHDTLLKQALLYLTFLYTCVQDPETIQCRTIHMVNYVEVFLRNKDADTDTKKMHLGTG